MISEHYCVVSINIVMSQVEAWKMARAGLLYTGQEDDVKCSWCGVIMGEWQYGDQVSVRAPLLQCDGGKVVFVCLGKDVLRKVSSWHH